MKFLCSFLILAGVFALYDAFPSNEHDVELRLKNDRMLVQSMRRMVQSRSAGPAQCGAIYVQDLGVCLDIHAKSLKDCDNAKQNAIDELKKKALDKSKVYKSEVNETCEDDCISLPDPFLILECFQNTTLTNSKQLSAVSNNVGTYRTHLKVNIENAENIQMICARNADDAYYVRSEELADAYDKCMNNN
ncbi:uncharacterized protein LOC129915228 [Episyrphus balteatus]|uniref:uncharacterized protein LOC129915228 n=1 Tax=Episyrphus balteatus TaxID=286459 RepID=UPI0024857FA8|nr:uncharacterized protein LOC129915228 [Episyrphus balteatus]